MQWEERCMPGGGGRRCGLVDERVGGVGKVIERLFGGRSDLVVIMTIRF
jgi:hypothetical protein